MAETKLNTVQTVEDWTRVLTDCGVKPAVVAAWAPVFADVINADSFSLGDLELDDFLGQVLVESQRLTRLKENLNYTTPERLCVVWPRRFPTRDSALPYINNPGGLAEKVYGGRMGNTKPGDGAKYPGRGLIMCTGADAYRLVGDAMGLDLLAYPELLEQKHYALAAAIAWWEKRVPDGVIGDVRRETRIVNGGLIALDERIALTEKAHEAIA